MKGTPREAARLVGRGFRFGLALQFAVGPVCVYIFQTAAASGFGRAAAGVCGALMGDGAYIAAAVWGAGAVLKRHAGLQIRLRRAGAAVLFLYGAWTARAAFHHASFLSPGTGVWPNAGAGGAFFGALTLTLSNPLTILFWGGVFSARVAASRRPGPGIRLFALGALLSAAVFLSGVAAIAAAAKIFFSPAAVYWLNAAVGALLMGFGVQAARGR